MKAIGVTILIVLVGLVAYFASGRFDLAGGGGDGGFPPNSPDFLTDFPAAKARAAETGKAMVVIFSASWCPPCQQNKKKLYPHQQVQPFHDRFVWVYLDVDAKKNQKFGRKYGVSGIPDIRVINASGEVLESFRNTGRAEDFVPFLERGLAGS